MTDSLTGSDFETNQRILYRISEHVEPVMIILEQVDAL